MIVQCDVCGQFIYERFCSRCGFDNSYQFSNKDKTQEIKRYIEALDILDDEILIQVLSERLGWSIEDITDAIKENEILGWNVEINE